MSVPKQIQDLIDRFDRNIDSYRSQGYNETQLRREFVDPFFEALGWDVTNKEGYAEAYKDVIHEDSVKIGGWTKAPDYSFRIGGIRKFFVETKKPAINVKQDVSPAYQLRRYAWSAKLALSILTDFEEFAVYDCRFRPKPDDKPSVGRILYLTYKDFAAKWDEIAGLFSKDALLKGSFDKFAIAGKGKRGTSEVDGEFLHEIEDWREALARNLALRNPDLSVNDLNYAVQKTIDRIIFLRMCEDRGVEEYGHLQTLLNGENTYARLLHLYRLADAKYNSGLFHFSVEKGRSEAPDELTPNLCIDNKVLKDIIRRLYYPDSPYEFSVLSADILGNVYEQFLGKVIRLTAGHRAVVEDKPEVKKAGGVYYTPSYIVDYIVKNTVGKLCEGKNPKQIEKIRILDPACGSGSFLIGAYTWLLDYHRDWHVNNRRKHSKEIYQGRGGQWFLTTQEKKRILLNNIYGVDIDSQAVEVTKLSILLKVLEGENQKTLVRQYELYRERALPDLGNNIKCGNSLIGPDYFEPNQILMFDDGEARRVNSFDWKAEFPEIMKTGGFDAVIGNPPYIFTRNQGIDELQKRYFYDHYFHQSSQLNTFGIFVERCYGLLRRTGVLSFITPNNWLTIDSFAPLRKFILKSVKEVKVVNILDRVFAAANVDTAIIFFEKGDPSILIISEMKGEKEVFARQVDVSSITPPSYVIQISLLKDLSKFQFLNKIESRSQPLAELCTVSTGLKVYQTGKGKPPQTDREKKNRVFHGTSMRNKTYGRYLEGADVCRYYLGWSGEYLSYGDWLAEPRKSVPFVGERLLVRQIPSSIPPYLIHATFTDEPFYNDINSMVIFAPVSGVSLKYILGLINSRLLSMWFLKKYDKLQRKIFPQFKVKELGCFPIYTIRFSNSQDKSRHDKVVLLVNRMLDLHYRKNNAKIPADKIHLERQINTTNRQIDQLVCELYGLTENEIAIVEGDEVVERIEMEDNIKYEEGTDNRSCQVERQTPGMAKTARHAGKGGRRASEGASGAGSPIDGVRERAGKYGPSQDPSEEEEGEGRIDSTRLFDTPQGFLPYSRISERLAGTLAGILEEILQWLPERVIITPDWICKAHQNLASELFPDWAGRYRDVNVQVGTHMPPPFYEVPGLIRLLCDDLAERLSHIQPGESSVEVVAELLAWVDWRFQWIHPFKDFNGRIGRVLLAALMYKLDLPHIESAPTESEARIQYLDALRLADRGDLRPLIELWMQRLSDAIQ